MNRLLPLTALVAALGLIVAGCGSGDERAAAGTRTMSFKITDAGCQPHDAKVTAGPIDFQVESESSTVTEIEVLDGEAILGEKENLTDGLKGGFSLNLEAGEYTLRCNGAAEGDGTLTVSGKAKSASSPGVEAAIAHYRSYLEKNADGLVATTKPFVAAVIAGDIARAEALYPATRVAYERIEPVAGSFGDLAEALKADVEDLARRVRSVKLQAVQIANGANELLSEVSATKITGEEERYSHIDLVDFKANVEGSEVAFEDVKPLMRGADKQQAEEIEADFAAVYAALEPYERGDGFVPYTALTKADTRKLARGIDALAERLSQVPAVILRAESSGA